MEPPRHAHPFCPGTFTGDVSRVGVPQTCSAPRTMKHTKPFEEECMIKQDPQLECPQIGVALGRPRIDCEH